MTSLPEHTRAEVGVEVALCVGNIGGLIPEVDSSTGRLDDELRKCVWVPVVMSV